MSNQEIDAKTVCEEIRRRQRYRRAPKSIADVLSGLMTQRGYAQVKSSTDCARAWEKAAGAEWAKDTRAGHVRRGVLEVVVGSSSLVQELTFQKKQLIKQLVRLAPEHKIRDIRFRVGGID